MSEDNRAKHNRKQIDYFDQRAELWLQPIPDDIQERTASIVASAQVDASSLVLDVGTGVGVLIGHFLDCGVSARNIVGCDLSERMLELAATKSLAVFFWLGDVMDFFLARSVPDFPAHIQGFTHIFFNACFANMLDRQSVLRHSKEMLLPGGKIVVSHAVPQIVSSLHESEPEIVPHLLPTQEEVLDWSGAHCLSVVHFQSTASLYLAIFERSG